MIILLCGPPGVGKTLTSEAVAEEMKVPLYLMSAGDLGFDPRHVETKLQDILEMCSRWNAVLLLDEADVFLEQRSLHELERNKLVSIFLRVLEYYEGMSYLCHYTLSPYGSNTHTEYFQYRCWNLRSRWCTLTNNLQGPCSSPQTVLRRSTLRSNRAFTSRSTTRNCQSNRVKPSGTTS